MDLAFTPEEQKFREEVHAWVRANLPAEISHKVHNALRLTRDENGDPVQYDSGQMPGANILWSPRLGFNYDISGNMKTQIRGGTGVPSSSAARAGAPSRNTCSRKNAPWPVRRASCPSGR